MLLLLGFPLYRSLFQRTFMFGTIDVISYGVSVRGRIGG